jgi:hypothetical protein
VKTRIFILVYLALVIPCQGRTITVDCNGSADFDNIQAAINDANDGDEIVVYPCTYTGDGNHDIDFLGKAITVRSTEPNDPCVVAATVIDCNGTEAEPHRGFNFCSAEQADSVLAGLTITRGCSPEEQFGEEPYWVDYPAGGAIFCAGASPTITLCQIYDNQAAGTGAFGEPFGLGGGICCDYASPSITQCTIMQNSALFRGGGIYSAGGSPIISHCTINDNSSSFEGGGIMWGNGGGTIDHCTISRNSASEWGAGICFEGTVDAVAMNNCHITGNSAGDSGGGVYCPFGSSPIISNCTISANAAGAGGGIFFYSFYSDTSVPIITKCVITNNTAVEGGGIGCLDRRPVITNCTISGNYAASPFHGWGAGGGLHCSAYGASPQVTNCTITGNFATWRGGGILSRKGSSPTVTNSIVWNNSANEGAEIAIWTNNNPAELSASYSNVRGGQGGVFVGAGCILNWEQGNSDTDPCFAYPGCWADVNDPNIPVEANDPNASWIEGDYHLKSQGGRWEPNSESWVLDDITSPCLDKGDWQSPIGDEPYPNGGVINMGAYGGTDQASKSPTITCWEAAECAGQLFGDASCDGHVGLADLFALKAHFGKSAPWTSNECCADFNHDESVNLADLFILKANYGSGSYSPSTGNQNCLVMNPCERPGGDITPPAPAPYMIAVEGNSPNSIAMEASEAYHECGVQYYFQCTAGGGHDSGWLDEPNYTDVNLVTDTDYCYRVKAREKSPNQNMTNWSEPACTRCIPPPCENSPTPDPMRWDETLDANGFDGWPREVLLGPDPIWDWHVTMRADPNTNHDCGAWEFYFQCVDQSGFDSGWLAFAAGPPYTYTVHVGLQGLQVRFRVKARDVCCWNETAWSPVGMAAVP